MKKIIQRMLALATAGVLSIGLLAGCSGGSGGSEGGNSSGVTITLFNSKGEIHDALEAMAKTYKQKTGVEIVISQAGAGESPYTRITTAYNSGTPPTIAMLDTTDIVALGESKAVDLSGERWIAECADNVTRIDGKVFSFPFCVEGRGLIYNKTVIEEKLGKAFDPATINSYDALESLLKSLRAAGMENPVVISKEDWSLGAHQLQYIYETRTGTNEDTAKVIEEIKAGTLKVADYDRFSQFTKTLDLLLEYNYYKKDPLGAVYEQDPIHLVDGDAALWFNGCWAWPNILEAGGKASDAYGFLPYVLGNDTGDFANTKIQASASKQIMIDKVKATDEQIQAAKDFLSWIVYDEEGQKALVEGCAIIPACKNNAVAVADPLGADIKAKMDAGLVFNASAIVPGDHWSKLGAQMQKYIDKKQTAAQLADEIDKYWSAQQ